MILTWWAHIYYRYTALFGGPQREVFICVWTTFLSVQYFLQKWDKRHQKRKCWKESHPETISSPSGVCLRESWWESVTFGYKIMALVDSGSGALSRMHSKYRCRLVFWSKGWITTKSTVILIFYIILPLSYDIFVGFLNSTFIFKEKSLSHSSILSPNL